MDDETQNNAPNQFAERAAQEAASWRGREDAEVDPLAELQDRLERLEQMARGMSFSSATPELLISGTFPNFVVQHNGMQEGRKQFSIRLDD